MSKEDQELDLEWLEELSAEPPIVPYEDKARKHGQAKQIKYQGAGWKYYISIKSKLPEWWDEFNGKTKKSSAPLYKNVWTFIKAKTKNKQQQEWLYQMFGPAPEKDQKLEVPWLRDWNKVRKNGYWNTEDGYEYRRLAKVIKNNIESNDAIKATAPFVIQDIVRFTRLQSKVEEVFNGQPFNDSQPILSGHNRMRFKTYLKMLSSVTAYKYKMIHEWMRIHGINPSNPHEMQDIVLLAQLSGQVGASAALTGYVAGQNIPANGQNLLSPGDTGLTRDAVLLAMSWKQKEKEYLKKIPDVVLDGDELVEKIPDKTNGKHKERLDKSERSDRIEKSLQ
jgi:hypothetical protein